MASLDFDGPSPLTTGRHYTYQDYRSWPEEERWELFHGTAMRDQTDKRDINERKGVREYWVVNPHTFEVLVYSLKDGVYGLPVPASLNSPIPVGIFPGLACPQKSGTVRETCALADTI